MFAAPMTDSAKPEEQPVDDVWKAAAYGNLDRTKDFIQTDPQLVNKPDATGYANFTRQIQPDADSAPQVKLSDSFVFQLPRDLPPFRSRTFKLPFHPPFTTRFLPLQWAALNNRVAVATFLIERGAAVNATDNDKQTPFTGRVSVVPSHAPSSCSATARGWTRRTVAVTTRSMLPRSTGTRG